MGYDAKSIGKILPGKHILPFPGRRISELAFDSRKIMMPAQALFFALHTTKGNGHQYIHDAYSQGVRNFTVQKISRIQLKYPDANFFVVRDSQDSLQQLAAHHRSQFHIPVIGITGSNGKTTTKEWLFQLLNDTYALKRNPKSYNSQIGVALSLWELEPKDELGIFEAGISLPGEMERLEVMIQPDIGILTNIGPAHDEGFESQEHKLREKLKLFANSQKLIYCRDHTLVHHGVEQMKKEYPHLQTLTWGKNNASDISMERSGGSITCSFGKEHFSFELAVTDDAAIEDAMHCLATLIALDLNPQSYLGRFKLLTHLPLRLELKNGINNCSLIYDCYNSDLRSLKIAFDFQSLHQQNKHKTVILSDILESGQPAESLYKQVAEMLESRKVKKVIGIGKEISQHLPAQLSSDIEALYFADTLDFLDEKMEDSFQEEIILIKGARKFAFERIGAVLEEKVHGTRLEINLGAIIHNLNVYQNKLDKPTRLMVMVKAFSYGTGSYEIANMLEFHHAGYLAVAYADEGVSLRKANIRLPIMVLNSDEDSMASIIRYDLEPEIFSLRSLELLLDAIAQYGIRQRTYSIHLKIDTGMHRLGFDDYDLPKALDLLAKNEQVRVASVFSHLAAADDPQKDTLTKAQINKFTESSKQVAGKLQYQPLLHLTNSVGMLRFPKARFDMVRLGLGLYGMDLSGEIQDQLQQVATLTTTITQIRHVPAGEGIGYGFKDKAPRDRKIATVSIGYADGYSRHFSGGTGYMLIRGFKAPVVGDVCMDMTMLDVTNIPEVQEGEQVMVFGESLNLVELAALVETIPYEIMANLSERVKRVYVDE